MWSAKDPTQPVTRQETTTTHRNWRAIIRKSSTPSVHSAGITRGDKDSCAQTAAPAGSDAAAQAPSPRSGCGRTRRVDGGRGRSAIDEALGPGDLFLRAMGDPQGLVRLETRLVLHDAIPGDAEAGEHRSEGGQAAHDHGPLQCADPRRDEGARQGGG